MSKNIPLTCFGGLEACKNILYVTDIMIKRSSANIVQILLLIIEEQQIKILKKLIRNQFSNSSHFQMFPNVFQMVNNNSERATKLKKSIIISSVKLE